MLLRSVMGSTISCTNEGDCALGNNIGEACCRADGLCSDQLPMSIDVGGFSEDRCECIIPFYNADDQVCVECEEDADCDIGESCCPETFTCEADDGTTGGACGDPHMTGFLGQRFDFTGRDGAWYALISDSPTMHLNMRITAPVPSMPAITYITGISLLTTDVDGLEHTIVISVNKPHVQDSVCPPNVSTCLADGSLNVVVDGEHVLLSPGELELAPGVDLRAVNIPGECRSFGFETYWEKKEAESAISGRRLTAEAMNMDEWILADPTATDLAECAEYVDRTTKKKGGLFEYQSEHASFQIVTPEVTIRVSHGRLHQLPMRDPTDQFDLPDHLTWQMNLAIERADVSQDAKGILGETFVPTRDADGAKIMHGMGSIRGEQEDYAVEGPLGMAFVMDGHMQPGQNE